MLAQQRKIDAGLDIKAVQKGLGNEVAQILIACFVLAQQHEVARLVVHAVDAVLHPARGDIDLAADHGVQPGGLAGAVEIDHAVHHAVIGDGDGRLPERLGALDELPDAAGAVEQAVFGVDVQMGKGHACSLLSAGLCFVSQRK